MKREETETQRGLGGHLRSHSQEVAELEEMAQPAGEGSPGHTPTRVSLLVSSVSLRPLPPSPHLQMLLCSTTALDLDRDPGSGSTTSICVSTAHRADTGESKQLTLAWVRLGGPGPPLGILAHHQQCPTHTLPDG